MTRSGLRNFSKSVEKYLSIVHSNAKEVLDSAEKRRVKRRRRSPNTPHPSKADEKDAKKIERARMQLDTGADQFHLALQSFVLYSEHPFPPEKDDAAARAPNIHSRVLPLIQQTELKKAKSRAPQADPSASVQEVAATGQSPAPVAQEPVSTHQHAMAFKIKGERRHSTPTRERRKQKWRRSTFRSRTDMADRYVPQTVNLDVASPITVEPDDCLVECQSS